MPSNKELQNLTDEQQETITNAREILEEAYAPEATRADLVEAVKEAIDVLSGEAEDAEEGDDDQDAE
jgi:hypothetical protein